MALSANLSMRQSQSMVMTPQLLQSIRLLQFTQLELDRFVQQQIENNPLIEQGSSEETGADEPPTGDDHPSERATQDGEESWLSAELETDAGAIASRLDTSVDNVFPEEPASTQQPGLRNSAGALPFTSSESVDLEAVAAEAVTLRDRVAEQLSLTFRDDAQRAIAWELADMLDRNGYLDGEPDDIGIRLGCTVDEIEAVLATLQQFDPPGVFARDLSECLSLQLARLDRLDPAMQALVANLPLLAKRDFRSLSRICAVDESDLVQMLAEIRALDPRPGLAFDGARVESIVHDVEVREAPDRSWQIELNPDALPRVIVDRDYYARVARTGLSVEEKSFMADCLQNATWLERSLDQRAQTILKVATEIVRQQDAFLAEGVRALKPMTMRMVADAIGMHESTISRVCSNKYMLTPRGMFEFRYFFTVAVGAGEATSDGHSSEAIRQRIRALIDAETPEKILSDDALVVALRNEGIEIARRTVAKYREGMNIASSVQRRREKRAMATAAG